MLLLLDLDNTIFETTSMNPATFEPLITLVEGYFSQHYGPEKAALAINDLWHLPFDVVATKHKVPVSLQNEFLETLENLNYSLDIQPYSDYHALRNIAMEKILVTTGFRKLQKAKIQALKIEADFSAQYIDSPFDQPRKHKEGIFREIFAQQTCTADQVWVIGDNPESELKAGKALGFRTVQRLHGERAVSGYADYVIRSFEELGELVS